MKQHLSGLLAALFVASQMAGCANMDETQRTTATGAAVGAVAGALLGGVTAGGNKTKSAATGAAIGAALGAGGGYLWSRHMQEQKAAMVINVH